MAIGITILLAAVVPGALPTRAVAIPLTAGSALIRARPDHRATTFAAPMPALDLRSLRRPDAPLARRTDAARASFAVTVADPPDAGFRSEALVARDGEAQFTGRRFRPGKMAAGLRLRMTASDGVLASRFDLSGPMGRALTRLAVEATQPQ